MALMKHEKKIPLYVFLLLLLSGCTTVLITGASAGVAYTFTNVAYKTIACPIDQVEFANRLALMKMKIKYVERMETGSGVRIVAETSELNIYINLEQITPKTTRISVDAKKSIIVKDKATADSIIQETESMLENK